MLRALAFAATLGVAPFGHAATIGEDGLHKPDWFKVTFKDVAEDIEEAREEGKRLAIVFEQRGCIYCRELHEKVLADPEVREFIEENFHVVQYNLFGDEEVTDLDGDALPEKKAARKWGVVYTPTIMFLPEEAPEGGTAAEAAVMTMPGAFGKWTTLNMFRFVDEKGYEGEEHFQKYHARLIEEARAAGRLQAGE